MVGYRTTLQSGKRNGSGRLAPVASSPQTDRPAPDPAPAARALIFAGILHRQATDDDAWFGIVFAAPGTDEDMCGVGRSVSSAREYQGPCRWGWIRGGTVRLGA